MASADTPLSGPDLRAGIAFSTLADGGMLLGHADDEPVLLVRRGDDVFAIGWRCTPKRRSKAWLGTRLTG